MDTSSIVSQLMAIDRQGVTRLNTQKSQLLARQQAYSDLNTKVLSLRTAASSLSKANEVMSFKADATDTDLMTGTATSAATPGKYTVEILNRSSASVLNGTSDRGSALDASAALNGTDALGSSFKEGTFTINGKQFSVSATESLNDVLAKITDPVTGVSGLTASYDSGTDKVTLTSATDPLVIGTAGDTSNLMSLLKLNSNGSGGAPFSSTSSVELGRLSIGTAMNAAGANGARARTAVSDGGGTGKFTVNGKEITFDADVDSISTVLSRITSSGAGVNASYDSTNDRIILTNKTGGSTGIALADVQGNFVSAMGLTGAITLGQNAKIKIDGGPTVESNDDVFSSTETGVTGLTLSLKADSGTTDVSVSTDTAAVEKKFNDFLTAYNNVISFIEDKSGVKGTGKNAVVGPLYGMQDVRGLQYQMRNTLSQMVSGLTSGPSTLSGIGLGTTGQSAKLSLDSAKLSDALTNYAENVKTILSDSTNGVMTKLTSYIDAQTLYGNGPLAEKAGRLDSSVTRIDKSIADFNKRMDQKEARLNAQFAAMEKAMGELQQGATSLFSSLGVS
jgi:flagellar hook-associated protein 2